MMNNQITLFLALAVLFFGIVAIFVVISSRFKRKKALKKYASKELGNSTASSDGLEKFEQYIPKVLSANTEDIDDMFKSAGYYEFKFASLYMPAKYIAAAIGAGLIFFLSPADWTRIVVLLFCGIWLCICISVPDMVLAEKKRKLKKRVSAQLPYLLDLLAMCVKTGMTIESSLFYLSEEMKGFDKHIAHTLNQTNARSRIVGLDVALDELYQRVPTNAMRSFVMTLKQSLHYGSSIYEVLTTLAADIREITLLETEERMGKLASKISVPMILFHMFPIVPLVIGPPIMRYFS